jgi:ribosomal protein S18 acetylase RimI-like enzyme
MQIDVAVRTETFRWGTAYFNPDYPLVWDLNFLEVERTGERPTADGLIAAAEGLQGPAGLGHRRIMLHDVDLAESLAPRFRKLGWMINKFLFMELVREPDPPVASKRARKIDRDTHLETYIRTASESPYGSTPEVVRQLAGQTDVIADAYDVRYFGAIDDDGTVASICVLYSDGEIAQVEDVATLKEYQGRGLATELLALTIAEAKGAGHDLIFLVADAEDWPKELYRRLGFDELGLSYDFVLPGDVVYRNDNA